MLPSSNTPSPAAPSSLAQVNAASDAPPVLTISLPLRFVATGLLSLFVGVVWLVFRPDILATYHYNQYIIALTHVFTLGWITSIIMGAMYQLVPVALETRLHSERLAKWQYFLHLIGMVGMVWMFWIWDLKQVGHFGSIMALGIGLFAYNIVRTLQTIARWNVIAVGIAAAMGWLSLTMLAGLFLTAAKCWTFSPFDTMAQMHAHAHLGGIGFFVMMMVAVSYKLVPMFLLTDIQSHRRAGWSIGLLNAGLAGLFVSLLLASPWKLLCALVVIAGLGVYGWELRAMVRARKRRTPDWGLRYFLTAVSLFFPLSALAVVLCWPGLPLTVFTGQLENVYGFLGLFGVVTLAILGMLYKIVPFLVWYHSYSREIGRNKVPTMGEMCSAPLQAVTYWAFLTALVAISVTTALSSETGVQLSCGLLAGTLVLFAINIARVLTHLIKPRIQPLEFHSIPQANS